MRAAPAATAAASAAAAAALRRSATAAAATSAVAAASSSASSSSSSSSAVAAAAAAAAAVSSAASRRHLAAATSPWAHVEAAPPDPILGLTAAFQADTRAGRMNLGVGAYRGDDGKPHVLGCVRAAEGRIVAAADLDHEYGPITGSAEFARLSKELVLGTADADVLARTTTAQALSGTGALRVAAEFVGRFNGGGEKGGKWDVAKDEGSGKPLVFLPGPTWANHHPLFADSGFAERKYRYYLPESCGLDLEGLLADIRAAPERSFFLFHSCAHNPTGVDPTAEEWRAIVEAVKEKGHVALMDTAYQGFATGDIDGDAAAPRLFAAEGVPILIAQSYAKNMGLYGHRVGAVSIVGADPDEAKRVDSQLKSLIRPMYSNPPIHGAKIVTTILGDAELRQQWDGEVKDMANRIMGMRTQLVDALRAEGSTRDWSHVTKQIGMFCFSGLTPEECDKLREEHAIYMTRNGRISVAGITSGNVGGLAKGIAAVTGGK